MKILALAGLLLTSCIYYFPGTAAEDKRMCDCVCEHNEGCRRLDWYALIDSKVICADGATFNLDSTDKRTRGYKCKHKE